MTSVQGVSLINQKIEWLIDLKEKLEREQSNAKISFVAYAVFGALAHVAFENYAPFGFIVGLVPASMELFKYQFLSQEVDEVDCYLMIFSSIHGNNSSS